MFLSIFDLLYKNVVFVLVTHEIPHVLTSKWLSRLVFACFIVLLLLVHCYSPFPIVFTVEHNPSLGSHTGGMIGSLHPAIHNHLLDATNIAEMVFKVSFCLFYCCIVFCELLLTFFY